MKKEIVYSEAFEEIQEIVSDIESGDISVDELSAKLKRATELIGLCKAKLFQTEEDVNQILKDLENEEG